MFGFFSADLYYDVLYQRFGHLPLSVEARGAMLFFSLLWPTFFMGVSLPLLARALTTRIQHAARVTGRLYACNTAGAAAGAFVATWVLLPAWGLERTLQFSAAVNTIRRAWGGAAPVGGCAASTADQHAAPPATSATDAAADVASEDAIAVPFAVWAAIYAVSGFLALSLEIVWFRLLGVMLKSTARPSARS